VAILIFLKKNNFSIFKCDKFFFKKKKHICMQESRDLVSECMLKIKVELKKSKKKSIKDP